MSAYAVCIVQPPGYLHSEAFREVGEILLHGLRRLGHDAVLSSDAVHQGRRVIVLGSCLLPSHLLPLPGDAIIYNLEQIHPGLPWLTPEAIELFRRHEVWDYSARNAARYAELGLARPRVVPIGHAPELVRIPKVPEQEDIDVLFYGSLNERRRVILDALRARGLRVEAVFGVYGEARDQLIARSTIVLNLHFYEAKVFEIVRVSYLLANGRCVVSERGADPAEEREFDEGIAFAEYGELVNTCARLARDPIARARLGEAGQAIMTRRDEVAYLREALAPAPALEEARGTPAMAARLAPEVVPPTGGLPDYYEFTRPEVIALARPEGSRVLDVGCAAGAMGAAMLAAGAREVVGIEVNGPAAAVARSRLTAVYGYDLDSLPELPYPEGYFEVITCADVLEHLRDPAAVLRHLTRWLAPSGRVVCSIPNVRHESVLLPLLLEGRWDYRAEGILDRTHLRFFTVTSAVRLLAEAGLVVDGQGQAVTTTPSPALARAAELVAALGGDAQALLVEGTVVQTLVTGRLAAARAGVARPLPDPWRGSRPVRVLVAPELADPADTWASALGEIVTGLGANGSVTVGIALPLAALDPPPAAVQEVAARAEVDLLLTEEPSDDAGWERLLGGTTVWITTSERPHLLALARRVGVKVQPASDQLETGGGRAAPSGSTAAVTGSRPLFSVLVPSYNQAHFLSAALDSLRAQTFGDWEALVVNDGSTDGTAEVMERYARQDPRIRPFHQVNGGVASALNRGLAATRGDWICWLSSDDLFLPEKLAVHAAAIQADPGPRLMHTDFQLLHHQTGALTPSGVKAEYIPPADLQVLHFLHINYFNGISIAGHRSVFEGVGGFDEEYSYGQDYDVWLRASARFRSQFLDSVTCVTRIHPGQGTALFTEAGIYDSARAALAFLNAHPFQDLFPLLDLDQLQQALRAVSATLRVALDPAAFVTRCGYGAALLDRLREWLASAPEPVRREVCRQVAQLAWPEASAEVRTMLSSIANVRPGTRYAPHDALAVLERQRAAAERRGDAREAAALQRYLAMVRGRPLPAKASAVARRSA